MDSEKIYEDTVTESEEVTREPGSIAERVMLASIGVVASACDTAEERFDRFVNRGQQARDDLQSRSEDVRRQNWRARNRARDYFRGAMDMVLDTFNVPSRTDVDTINVKLNILTRKLDDLQIQPSDRAAGTPASPPVAPEPPVMRAPSAPEDLAT